MSAFRSTAITTSAPSARASDTGTGFTNPPSTSSRSSCHTGVNSPGSANEARTASATEPSRSHTSSPVRRAVATAPKRSGSDSMAGSAKWRRKNATSFSPLSMPPPSPKSMNDHTARALKPRTHCSKRSRSPAAYAAPTMAPTDAPATMSGLSPASASACNTPMCAQPRAEPLPRARPIRGRRGVTR